MHHVQWRRLFMGALGQVPFDQKKQPLVMCNGTGNLLFEILNTPLIMYTGRIAKRLIVIYHMVSGRFVTR